MLCNFYKENIESEESPARMEWRKTKDFFFKLAYEGGEISASNNWTMYLVILCTIWNEIGLNIMIYRIASEVRKIIAYFGFRSEYLRT